VRGSSKKKSLAQSSQKGNYRQAQFPIQNVLPSKHNLNIKVFLCNKGLQKFERVWADGGNVKVLEYSNEVTLSQHRPCCTPIM
jgi:hypothetical protein